MQGRSIERPEPSQFTPDRVTATGPPLPNRNPRRRDRSPARRPASLPGRGLNARHVAIAEAEMVPDFMNQHVPHDIGERGAGGAAIGKDRLAIEKDHVDMRVWVADALMRQGDAAIEAEQRKWAFQSQRRLRVRSEERRVGK